MTEGRTQFTFHSWQIKVIRLVWAKTEYSYSRKILSHNIKSLSVLCFLDMNCQEKYQWNSTEQGQPAHIVLNGNSLSGR